MDEMSKRRKDISTIGCRSCEDFKTWSKEQNQIYHTTKKTPQRSDCPLDRGEIGRSTWGLLHTISVLYSKNPTDEDKSNVTTLINSLSKLYPCESCAEDFQDDLKVHPVDASSRDALSQWMCNLHNRVNEKLGKPIFDCSKVYQRWKDGWLDGSCD